MTEIRPDIMKLKWEEAKAFLTEWWSENEVLVLEDHHNGEIVSRVLLGGSGDEYHLVGKNLETDPPREWEKTVNRNEAAEMIAGWSVVERRRFDREQAVRQ